MATKTIITKVDDIDGSPADATYTFSWQGNKYRVDLSKAHAAELKADMAKWIKIGRRVRTEARPAAAKTAVTVAAKPAAKPAAKAAAKPAKAAAKSAAKPAPKAVKPAVKTAAKPARATKTTRRTTGRRRVAAKKTGPSPAEIRAWAMSQGIKVADRGRLAPALVEQYVKAHAAPVVGTIREDVSRVEATHVGMPYFGMSHIG